MFTANFRVWRGNARHGSARRGSVSIVVAVMLPVMVGMAGLGAEYSHGVETQLSNQRVADLAAFSGALAYSKTTSVSAMTNAVYSVTGLNGLSAGDAAASLQSSSPSGDGNAAVKVTITSTVPLVLSKIIGNQSSLTVSATAYAEIKPTGTACVIALSTSGTGITFSGGTSMSAPGCAVASNGSSGSPATGVAVPNGTSLTTIKVTSLTAVSSAAKANIHPAGISYAAASTADPMANNTVVAAAKTYLQALGSATMPALAAVTVPTVPSGVANLNFGYYTTQQQQQQSPPAYPLPSGCVLAGFTGGPWTVTCTGAGPFNFSGVTSGPTTTLVGTAAATWNFNGDVTGPVSINVPSGSTINIKGNVIPTGTTSYSAGTYNIGGYISTAGTTSFGAGTFSVAGSGGSMNAGISATGTTTFGAGTFKIAHGIYTGGGSTTTFGAGTFALGQNGNSCGTGGSYSICHTGSTLTLQGPSSFTISNGIFNSGGETIVLGSGTTNSYRIGPSNSGGNAIYNSGGSKLTMADATGAGDLFQLYGTVQVSSGGGSCTVLPAATQHDIKGSLTSAGGTTLGAGVYSITGYVALGENGGGATNCNGSQVGMSGANVTLEIGGSTLSSSGSCSGYAYCVAAGFSNVTLTAPTSGGTSQFVIIGPLSGSTGGMLLSEGASSTSLSGVVYFPNGPITMSGGANLGNGTGECLQLIGAQVSQSGGTTLATTCTGLAGGSAASSVAVVLVD